jgi:hypothetical protein
MVGCVHTLACLCAHTQAADGSPRNMPGMPVCCQDSSDQTWWYARALPALLLHGTTRNWRSDMPGMSVCCQCRNHWPKRAKQPGMPVRCQRYYYMQLDATGNPIRLVCPRIARGLPVQEPLDGTRTTAWYARALPALQLAI